MNDWSYLLLFLRYENMLDAFTAHIFIGHKVEIVCQKDYGNKNTQK